jgi:bla regulator protein blaR1
MVKSRVAWAVVCMMCGVAAVLSAQLPASPAFEVASIKPNKSGDPNGSTNFQTGGRYTARNMAVRALIREAYRLQGFQIVGGPDWIASDRFDILAKAESDLPNSPDGPPQTMFLMLRRLLAERFKLAVHNETRELPVYALVMARSDEKMGPQLRQPAIDCSTFDFRNSPTPPPGGFCGGIQSGPGRFIGKGATMRQLALNLSPRVARIVIDKTGLNRAFDFDLEWTSLPVTSDAPATAGPAPADLGPSIFTALQEQLGLKLDSQKGPVEVLVIDRVEHPTED